MRGLGIGDWGLGIGDWAQSPIPNPQSPFTRLIFEKEYQKNITEFIHPNKLILNKSN